MTDSEKSIGDYNLQITITDIGYQIDFINPQKYNENFMELQNEGIIEGSICRDYGLDVNQDRAIQAILDFVKDLESVEGVELTKEEYEEKERKYKEQFG